jgi:hypothetical protein
MLTFSLNHAFPRAYPAVLKSPFRMRALAHINQRECVSSFYCSMSGAALCAHANATVIASSYCHPRRFGRYEAAPSFWENALRRVSSYGNTCCADLCCLDAVTVQITRSLTGGKCGAWPVYGTEAFPVDSTMNRAVNR